MKKKSNNKQNENNQSLREIRMQEKRIRTRRFITFTILEILTLGLIFGYTAFFKRYSRIQRYTYAAEDVQNNDISVENIKKMEGYWNIAVFGVDSRNSSVTKGNNSDVIMIVSPRPGRRRYGASSRSAPVPSGLRNPCKGPRCSIHPQRR